MGIFDSAFNDPETMGLLAAASGLFQAGGPSRVPVGLGQALGQSFMGGLQGYASAMDRQADLEDKKMMRDYRKAQIAELERKAKAANDLDAFFKSRLMPTSGTMPTADMDASVDALTQGARIGDVGPTVTNAARMNAIRPPQMQGPNSAFPFGLNDVAYLKTKGIDLADVYKLATDPIKLEGGSTYRDRGTGQERFMPKMGEGMTLGANGAVSAAPGYANTVAAIEAAKQRAAEEQKASFDLLPLGYVGQDGRPIGGTRMDFIRQSSPQQNQPAPASATPTNFPTVAPADQAARDQEALLYAKQDIDNAPTLEAKAQAQQVYDAMLARANAGQSVITGSAGGAPVLQSEAEKEAAIGRERAKNAAFEKQLKDEQERVTKATGSYQRITAAIPMARELLKKATGSGAGAATDAVMGFFGESTESSEAASQLETLSGWLVANVPRMEGPQSNFDVNNYQVMAAMVGDRTKPVAVRLKALETLEALQQKYADINNVTPGAAPPDLPTKNVPQGAINLLKMNPRLREQFDAKYGRGAAQKVLGQ